MEREDRRNGFPVMRVLMGLFALLFLMLCGGGFLYLDYHAGSTSSSFIPDAFEVSAIDRGFQSGNTRIEFNKDTGVIAATVADHDFEVTRTAVTLDGKKLTSISDGVKSVEISSYRGTIDVVVDGKTMANLSK